MTSIRKTNIGSEDMFAVPYWRMQTLICTLYKNSGEVKEVLKCVDDTQQNKFLERVKLEFYL